uniref:RING-type E3 ubiquitin transferase n=2 Tax=Cajanus cajan TaxID=3821 RepID=A0A151SSX8_CAJCA|nr:RING-H2 finger protein ATL5F [Cajanus cajan]
MERSIDDTNCQSNSNLLTSFKYKEKEAGKEGFGDDYECPVCLSGFEEGEDVRKLPQCKHSFHAACIDMWLYSHLDCPICRTPVGPFCEQENSGSGGALLV